MQGDAGFLVGLVATTVVPWDAFAFLGSWPYPVAKLEVVMVINWIIRISDAGEF